MRRLLLLLHTITSIHAFYCPSEFRPHKLAATAVWVKKTGNQTSQYRISDEDLTVRNYTRVGSDQIGSIISLARHPQKCVVPSCSIRLSAYELSNDHAQTRETKNVKNVDDDFYCVTELRSCGAEIPIYRFVKHSVDGPQYTYGFDTNDIAGFQREFKPICYGWSQSPSVVVYNSSQTLCMQLDSVKNGEINYSSRTSHVYPIGTMASLNCLGGYSGVGQSQVLCTQKGWYPKVGLGQCLQASKTDFLSIGSSNPRTSSQEDSANCPIDTKIMNGTILTTGRIIDNREVPTNTRVTVVCNPFYTPTDPITTSKCSDGQWVPPLVYCVGIFDSQCPIIPNPENGKMVFLNTTKAPYAISSTVKLECDNGFYVLGNSSTTCTRTGWSNKIGSCLKITTGHVCSKLSVTNGEIIYAQGSLQTNYSSGTTAFLMCNYSIPSGSSSSYCSNGTWTPAIGSCVSLASLNSGSSGGNCQPHALNMNGMINYSPLSLTGQYSTGTVANLTCITGFSLSGSSISTCHNGTWSPLTLGNCTYVGASAVLQSDVTTSVCFNPFVFNGEITYSSGTTTEMTKNQGTVATLTCNSGYTRSGTYTSTCESTGMWSPTLGTCEYGSTSTTATCTAMLTPLGGSVSYSGLTQTAPFSSGTIATLVCSGTLPQGTSTATCSNGAWSPNSLGICSPASSIFNTSLISQTIECTAMFAPLGGTVTYSTGSTMGPFATGTTARATCTNGGTITGSSTATCSSGMWNPAFFGYCPLSASSSANCSTPSLPSYSTATYSTGSTSSTHTSGTIATVTCTSGTILAISTCLSGTWSPAISGTCSSTSSSSTGACTSAISTPTYGHLTYSTGQTSAPFNDFTMVTLTCTSGTLVGTSTSTCISGAWSPTTLGTCSTSTSSSTTCSSTITAPTYGYVVYSNGAHTGPFPDYTIATAYCNSSLISGTGMSTCVNGVWSPTTFGTCTSTSSSGSTCSTPTIPSGATATYSPTGSYTHATGTVATIHCSGVQIAVTTCYSGTWVPAISATCSSTSTTTCQTAPTIPTGATLTYSTGTYFAPWASGTRATMTCASGHHISGTSITTCSSGSWTPSLGTCVTTSARTLLKDSTNTDRTNNTGCAPFGALTTTMANGTLNYTPALNATVPIGSLATVTCFTGYVVSGAASTVCTSAGWEPTSLGTCSPIAAALTSSSCVFTAPMVLNGVTTYSDGQTTGPFTTGTVATTTCNLNYIASGTLTTTCLNGVWNPSTLGTCNYYSSGSTTAISCVAAPAVLFGTILYSSLSSGTYPAGTTATLLCNLGYRVSGQSLATCTNGIWSPSGLGVCVSATTLLRLPPANITMTKVGSVHNGTELLTANQTLTSDDFTIDCPPPVAPAFGEITFSSGSKNGSFEAGTTAALKCALGYNSAGATFSTCSRGSFRPILGSCLNGEEPAMAAVCMPLAPPRNARITYIQTGNSLDFDDGTTALLYCEEGFAVTGTATLQCRSGTWHPPTGFGTCDESNIVRRL